MARTQVLDCIPNVTCPVAGVAVPLVSDPTFFVKSLVIQALPTNTGEIRFGGINGQEIVLTGGRSATIMGDNMDNGTTAKIQVSNVFVKATVGGEGVAVSVLENL